MKIWTYKEIEDKIKRDLDLQDEDFVTTDEMVGYCNDAIDEAEAEIIALSEDYFLKPGTITLANGTADYALPSDIYAQKIRGLVYKNGTEIYPILPLYGQYEWEDIENTEFYAGNQDYRYKLINPNAGEQAQLRLIPASRDAGPVVRIWYIRNAQRVPLIGEGGADRAAQLATLVDIPEFAPFIIAFMKVKCVSKEFDPRYDSLVQELQHQREMMTSTLKARTPDNHRDKLPGDYEFYVEMN